MAKLHIILLVVLFTTMSLSFAYAEVSEKKQKELERAILFDCAFCHGFNLEGGEAPPLLPYNLRQWPDYYLVNIIRRGRPGTRMPSWVAELSHEEILWIIHWLKDETRLDKDGDEHYFDLVE